MAGSSSGLYLNGVLAHPSWSGRPSKRARTSRSVWNSTDDWEELVAASTLSTASVSSRPARPRGLQSLATCAEISAWRNFKRLYEEGKVRSQGGEVGRGWWEVEWEYVPDHLKARVRAGVYKRWGGVLKLDVMKDLFLIPPELVLPGHLIPALASTSSLKPPHPPPHLAGSFTSLRLQHCPQVTDIAIAGLIHHLPNLEYINLKGCSLAGAQTVKTILKRCKDVRGLNLKGTKVGESELKALLNACGDRLERLKIDNLSSHDPDEIFASAPYPALTHLCIPGDLINAPAQSFRARAQQFGHTIPHPPARPTRTDADFTWDRFDWYFPALTHLYLPGLLIPPRTEIRLNREQLVKLSLGAGGPPVPVQTITNIVQSQSQTLKSLHIGHLQYTRDGRTEFEKLGEALLACEKVEDFRFVCEQGGSKDLRSDQAMKRFSDLVYVEAMRGPWRSTLKYLHLSALQKIPAEAFIPLIPDNTTPPLEHLSLPSADIDSAQDLATALRDFRNLRTLDLSGTSVTTEQVFDILDSCALLSRIDLTSCRGVGVRLRRGVFSAWEEDRAGAEGEGVEVDEREVRRTRRRRG